MGYLLHHNVVKIVKTKKYSKNFSNIWEVFIYNTESSVCML